MRIALILAAMALVLPCAWGQGNLDDTLTGWTTCIKPSCDPGGVGTPTSTSQTINNASPALDGKSMAVSLTGPVLSGGQTTNALWYYKHGASNQSTAFTGYYHAYIASTSNVAALEFDQFQFVGGVRYMFGSQCVIGGFWQIWNELTTSWVNTSVSCSFSTSTWHTIIWQTHRVAGDTSCSGHPCMYYDALTIDSTTYTGFTAQPSNTTSFGDDSGLQVQIDVDASGGTATEYFDGIEFATSTPNWVGFIDPTRAIDWTTAGFTIPSYSVNCATQPSLSAGSGNASANHTAIQNALNSCDSTHNVVNIPSGTWYVTSIAFGTQGNQVLRGAGPTLTTIIATTGVGCAGGLAEALCMKDSTGLYNGSSQVLPPSGTNQCLWTGGLSQGSTSITLSSCGGTPPNGQTIILDQADDTMDTTGVYICDVNITNCGYQSNSGGNNNGRFISGKTHSMQQVVKVTGVTSLGGGSYTVTITPGVFFTNVRSGMDAGAWWPGFVQNDGVENMTIDGTSVDSTIGMYDCYQCWVKNVRFLTIGRNAVNPYQSAQDVIRDSYFYKSQNSASDSYGIEFSTASGVLVENNIFQQITTPIMMGAGTGNVIGYNYNVDVNYTCNGGCPSYGNGAYQSHNAGNQFNLFEGNSFFAIWSDNAWGSAGQSTYFRNLLQAYQNGKTASTFPVMMRSYVRGINIVGNVLGQTGYHTQYQAIATSTSGGTGAGAEDTSIFSIGWAGTGAVCSSGFVSQCDPVSGNSLMRWANYDTVTAGTKFDTSEASPAAVTYMGANFSSSYFSGLAHTLPASLYYSSQPSWWTGGKNWPAIGFDVSSGNVGYCTSGTYAKAQALTSGQCVSGGLTTGWASHATSIPAEDCYLNTMGGVPDGTGSALSFDANSCYSITIGTSTVRGSIAVKGSATIK